MPNDNLQEDIDPIRRAALEYIADNRRDPRARDMHVRNLKAAIQRLSKDIDERSKSYLIELDAKETKELNASRMRMEQDQRYQQAVEAHKAIHRDFQDLRRVNGGGFPKNISPVLYSIPLILIGVAEWYVNYETFAAIFIPVFAIAATLIVAAVFAGASHIHGAYLKQISEIIHPSVEYRNVLGRKIVLVIASVLLIAAFVTVIWLRWLVVTDQLGISNSVGTSTFGGASSSMVWSRVGPTIIINILIWGLGVLYSWTLHEKVPELREKYRDDLRASRVMQKNLKPFLAEQNTIKAHFEREREGNTIAINEDRALLEDVKSTFDRIQENGSE